MTKRQTKYSGNNYWSNIILHNEAYPGNTPENAIVLTQDYTGANQQ